VREYWVLNPEAETVMVYLLGADGRYGRPQVLLRHETLRSSAVPALVLELAEVFED
jgi:Uma2 family endonuclease